MKFSLAIVATTFAVAAEAEKLGRRLSFEKVASYKPDSQVTDHCAIDLDQAAIETLLAQKTDSGFEAARNIYNSGGNSKSYAQITLTSDTGLTRAVQKGDTVSGLNAEDNEVAGKFGDTYEAGTKNIKVYYETTDVQQSYVQCQVGQLTEPNMEGCYKSTGELTIGGTAYPYTYVPASDNNNGRTIAGFSLQAADKMLNDCPGCPYTDFKYFYDYYGTAKYGHEWVEAAFEGRATAFPSGKGNADFTKYSKDGLEQIIKKGTVYMNVFMYVIREMEDALDDCKRGLLQDNYNSVQAWDEGVCFYTGSIEGQDGVSDDGKLLHQLADKRCQDFKTCGVDGIDTAGQSKANYDIFDLFTLGNFQITSGECSAARQTTKLVAQKMYVPMIQGAQRYAYKVGMLGGAEKEKAEGAVFMAAVVPRIHAASPQAAQTIYDNLKVGASSVDYAAVKSAFESVYPQLGITCADVGGLWNEGEKNYYPGMEPCSTDASTMSAESSDASIKNTLAVVALGCTFGALFAMW